MKIICLQVSTTTTRPLTAFMIIPMTSLLVWLSMDSPSMESKTPLVRKWLPKTWISAMGMYTMASTVTGWPETILTLWDASREQGQSRGKDTSRRLYKRFKSIRDTCFPLPDIISSTYCNWYGNSDGIKIVVNLFKRTKMFIRKVLPKLCFSSTTLKHSKLP